MLFMWNIGTNHNTLSSILYFWFHRLAQEEFLVRTRSQTDEWLDKVYGWEYYAFCTMVPLDSINGHRSHICFFDSMWLVSYFSDLKLSRINQLMVNWPPLCVKMYSPSLVFSFVLSERDYPRNRMPSSFLSVSSYHTCDRHKFINGITFYRIWKHVVLHLMTLRVWVRSARIWFPNWCHNVNSLQIWLTQ